MADVTVAGDAVLGNNGGERHGIVWTDVSTGYFFYVDDAVPSDYRYRKTTDGGLTWGSPVTINTAALLTGRATTIYYDRFTPGDTGNLIHIIWTQSGDPAHRTLDTSDDSLSSVSAITSPGQAVAIKMGLGKLRSGDLWMWWASNDATFLHGVRRSTDGGSTWSDPGGTNPIEVKEDDALILPASNTGDDNDMWLLYHDASANQTSLKFWDDSATDFTETGLGGVNTVWGAGQTNSQWMAGVWHDDGHASLLVHTRGSGTSGDYESWEINSETSFTQRADLLTADTPSHRSAVTLVQKSGRLYGVWIDGNTGSVDYKISDDRGATWGSTKEFSDGNPGSLQRVYAMMSVRDGDGGRFMPVWFENDATAHETNFDNSISTAPPAAQNIVVATHIQTPRE